MRSMPASKYRPYPRIALPDRRWPERVLTTAPRWCSVDLRDGNQALVQPMSPEQKLRFFAALVDLGFEEIEVAYPASSEPERAILRRLIEEGRIPDDVTVQVLTPARRELIHETFESVRGARRVIVHLHNPTSELQRRVVFKMDRAEIIALAVDAAEYMQECRALQPETEFVFEYSPESFTGTEPDFALEICLAVLEVWRPTPTDRTILNLAATVEMSTPNVYADRIEWFCRELTRRGLRECVVVSVHPHNDRGCAVAAAELSLLAGADRVEGTLFGNGERTGNVDLVTLALNLYSQGVDPQLAFWDIDAVVRLSEEATQIQLHPRHPYAGRLVYTAFSGSHQDAIRKGFAALEQAQSDVWEVPYLPIDPKDLGRSYEGIIRINSQSGKGGIAYVVERGLGIQVPRGLAVEFSRLVQERAEASGSELAPEAIIGEFERAYLQKPTRVRLGDVSQTGPGRFRFELIFGSRKRRIEAEGPGPIAAFVRGVTAQFGLSLDVLDYAEHTLSTGADAEAIAFVQIGEASGRSRYGVGRDADIVRASLQALLSALDFCKLLPDG